MRLLLVSIPPAHVATVNVVHTRIGSCSDAAAAATVTLPVCPVIEVSGSIVGTNVTIDPAFDLLARPAAQSRPETDGNATLTAYNVAGQLLVTFPFSASGVYRVDVPLSPAIAESVHVLRVTTASASAERVATTHGEPSVETIAINDSNVVLAWNAQAFPALRITAEGEAGVAYVAGKGTYQQSSLHSKARRISIDFSDGVRSVKRTFAVFGR